MSKCPKCGSEYGYNDGNLWVCPECAHEWSLTEEVLVSTEGGCLDSNRQVLIDGDSVVLIKDLKVKGASGSLKKGTKIKNIRLIDPIDGHNISCKVDGFGAMNLKSEFVKKV